MMCGMCCECAVIPDVRPASARVCGAVSIIRPWKENGIFIFGETLGKRPKSSARPEGQARAVSRPLGALPRFAAEALGPWHAG